MMATLLVVSNHYERLLEQRVIRYVLVLRQSRQLIFRFQKLEECFTFQKRFKLR
jgi:hypothetical protein